MQYALSHIHSDGSRRCYLATLGADASFISSPCFDSQSLSSLIRDLDEAFRAARWGDPALYTNSGKRPIRFLFSASGRPLGKTANFDSEIGLVQAINKWKDVLLVDGIADTLSSSRSDQTSVRTAPSARAEERSNGRS